MVYWPPAQVASLPDNRLHLQHGPIDLVIKAVGDRAAVKLAYAAAIARFDGVLPELVAELAKLRTPLTEICPVMKSPIARAMVAACWPFREQYITPMAAVAGAVADEIKSIMLDAAPGLLSLFVNNGGDISVHVMEGQRLTIGLVQDLSRAIPTGKITLDPGSRVGGVATSGWRGRSFSLGIADAVTVLARSAAEADAAATMIANAINVDSPSIKRASALELDPDTDLGTLPVTVAVGELSPNLCEEALTAGERMARDLLQDQFLIAAALVLQNHWRVVESHTGLLLPVP